MNIDSLNLEHQMDMEISKTSFPYFFQHVLGFQFTNYMQEWYDLINESNRTTILCSRGHGKSVFMHAWAVWNLCFQPAPYKIVYISSNQKQTNMHMKDISNMFNSPVLQQFKPKGSSGWAVEEMNLTNGNSIVARSVKGQIRGLHPQEVIIDDPLKEFSLVGIQQVNDWFFGDLGGAIHTSTKLRIIGTPFSYVDLYATLASPDMEGAYEVRSYPCLNALNEPLWPERWNYDDLMQKKKEIGSLMFAREYMLVPVSTGTSLFNPEYLDSSKNRDLILKPFRRENYKYYIGVDPSISTDGDYNVITVLEVDENENKSIVYIDRSKNVEFRENVNKVRMLGKIFNPEVIYFETNTFAKAFTQELRNVADLNVHDFDTTRKKKQEIILNLQMTIENGKMNFPTGNEESRRVTAALIEELSYFAITDSGRFEGVGAHDDMVMSLALANAATYQVTDHYLLLDDLGIFDDNKPVWGRGGVVGLNF